MNTIRFILDTKFLRLIFFNFQREDRSLGILQTVLYRLMHNQLFIAYALSSFKKAKENKFTVASSFWGFPAE